MDSIFGLIGEKLGHSFSPVIHSIILKELGIKGYYHLFELGREALKDAVHGLKVLKARGVNVTIPYKAEIMKYLDGISEEACKIDAVNTICFEDGKAVGYNTDYYGFGIMLERFDISVKGKEAVVLGTGGAAKAVLQYLLDKGIKDVAFVSRGMGSRKHRFRDCRVISYDSIKKIGDKDIIINCTPCGMYPEIEKCPVAAEDMSGFGAAVDLVYNPIETLFLKHARAQGVNAVNGLYMLVGQAVKAQELWNNIEIDAGAAERIYERIRIGWFCDNL